MKNSLFFIFMFGSCMLEAQKATISADKMNVCYFGVDNPLTIVAENCSYSQLVVEIDNGVIKGKDCHYIYRPEHSGAVNIKAQKKSGKRLSEISKWQFRVKKIPDPVFKVGPYSNGARVNMDIFITQRFVRADLENFDFDARFRVDSFKLKIFSKDSLLKFSCSNQGNRFGAESYNGFLKLEPGDVILFDSINVHGPDVIHREIAPVMFLVSKTGNVVGPFAEPIYCD